MNAKKIMGAVLVALLAAALFVGAGAAASLAADGDIVFVNQKVNKTDYGGNWVGPNGAYTPATVPGDAPNVSFSAAGTYTATVDEKTVTLTVKAPELVISGLVPNMYTFIPGDFYQGSGDGTIYIQNPASVSVGYTLYFDGVKQAQNDQITVEDDRDAGKYAIQAEFAADGFVAGTTPAQLITAPVYLTVVDEESAVSISAAATSVLKTDNIKLTVTGQPGIDYNVTFDAGAFKVDKQIGFNNFKRFNATKIGANSDETVANLTGIQFTMPAGGKAVFNIKAAAAAGDSEKIKVNAVDGTKTATVSIEFLKGTITAKADAASYFVGDKVTITGTTTAGDIEGIYLKGTNFVNNTLIDYDPSVVDWETEGKNFEFTLDTSKILDDGKKLDVGTYTLTLNASGTKATVPLVLKQPFISIVDAPEVVVQDTEVEFIINAEAAEKIAYYIFGTNYFAYSTTENHPDDEDGEAILTQFVVKLNKTQTDDMDAGQYFAVFQHPMYDKELNIKAVGTKIQLAGTPVTDLFNVDTRQTANAAQALCDALDTQNIDDMYVKYSFFVVGEDESFSISEIPSQVVKGDKIVISGVDTANADETVVVEMISTAFAAVPKETVGSAAFIVVTTTVAKDGTWEVTLDTSDLNVDEYSLSVAIKDVTKKNVNINVVEGADKPDTPDTPDVPDTPDTPDTPTEPETPGFGALAALAGLGAVAVLLLRRE